MRPNLRAIRAAGWLCAALSIAAFTPAVFAAELKFQTQLVWGTDDSNPPAGKNYKPVEADILKKLRELPLKWKNYFEVKRTDFAASPAVAKKVALSDNCELNVLGQSNS